MKFKLILFFSLLIQYSYAQTKSVTSDDNKGLLYIAELGYGVGVGNVRIDNSILDSNYERTFGAGFLATHQFDNDLALGGSVFYNYYSDSGFLLLGPDLRYFLNRSLFVAGNAGYGISIDDERREGGFYYHPSAGLILNRQNSISYILSLGFMHQFFREKTDVTIFENGTESTITQNSRYSVGFLQFTAGVLF